MIIGVHGQHRVVGPGHRFAGHNQAGIILIRHGRADLRRAGHGNHRVYIIGIMNASLADIHGNRRILIVRIGKKILFLGRGSGVVQAQRRYIRMGGQAGQTDQQGQQPKRGSHGFYPLHRYCSSRQAVAK